MKQAKRKICVFICVFIVVSIFTPTFAAEQNTTSSEISLSDEKIYSNATIDEEFVDNHVLVVMDRGVSAT